MAPAAESRKSAAKMAALLLEDYLESTEHVPQDMKANLSSMRTLDLRVQSESRADCRAARRKCLNLL